MTRQSHLLNVIVDACQLRGSVLCFDLKASNGADLPVWEAGAHIDLYLEEGLIRQYSLCGNPADRKRYSLAVLLDPKSRGGSVAVHRLVRDGVQLQISLPRNLFPLDCDAQSSLLVGGGIGVTPMIAMAYELYDKAQNFALHYVARDPVFAPVLQALPFAAHVVIHDHSQAERPRFNVQNTLAQWIDQNGSGVHVYVCGPEGLMQAVAQAGSACGLPEEHVHQEAFSAQPVEGGSGFEVLAAKSGVRVQVAEDETIAAAFARSGVRVPVSCEQGICGTCVVSVLEGEPDHRDEYLTDEEKTDQIALCCSRSKTPLLVVDL